jgi:hypothetical protein
MDKEPKRQEPEIMPPRPQVEPGRSVPEIPPDNDVPQKTTPARIDFFFGRAANTRFRKPITPANGLGLIAMGQKD